MMCVAQQQSAMDVVSIVITTVNHGYIDGRISFYSM